MKYTVENLAISQEMDILKAINCKECEGCKHRFAKEEDLFCYMFKDKPNIVPCGQHNKYEIERNVMGMLFKKYPTQMKFALSVMLNDTLLSDKLK